MPTFQFVTSIGDIVLRRARDNQGKIETFYVVYILSAGLIDDLSEVLNSIDEAFAALPIQIHIINLSGSNLVTDDLDTIKFQDYTMKYNLYKSCYLQTNVHFYDRIKSKFSNNTIKALL